MCVHVQHVIQIKSGVYCFTVYRALENTLHLMNSKNESFRKGLTKVDKSSKFMSSTVHAVLDVHVLTIIVCR